MVEEKAKQRTRRSGGRFYGFRANCEDVPCLPACVARAVIDDPRKIPYLLVWRDDWNEIKEVVRLVWLGHYERAKSARWEYDWLSTWVEIKRCNGTSHERELLYRSLPRNGGRALLLVCGQCGRPCRALYGYKVGINDRFYGVVRADWLCRKCASLRYASEGGALRISFRTFGLGGYRENSPRPDPWYPFVFSNPEDAAMAALRGQL